MKDYNFTQPFAMKCDAEQFESVKNELEKMGYSDNGKSDGCIYFTNNVDNTMGNAGLILPKRQYYYHRLVIETFNRPLLLALAAMTDKLDGIIGEWWMCNIGDNIHFIKDKLYQQNGMIGNFPQFVSEKDEVIACDVTEWFRKATADELIRYFEQKSEKSFIQEIEQIDKDIAEMNYSKSEPQPTLKTTVDMDYVKSMELWIEKQKLCNKLKYADIKHEQKSIKLRKKILKASIADYEIEHSRLADAETMLSKFKSLRNIN